MSEPPEDWFWEGNIVDALIAHLSREGWTVVSKANTQAKERGIDIHARKDSTDLLVEAKGYPSKKYRDAARAAEVKPTNPTLQAQHWYSHAILKALRLQTHNPDAMIALAFPDFPRYRTLFDETRGALEKLNVGFFFVRQDGSVDKWHLP
jgi:hypothetical protein